MVSEGVDRNIWNAWRHRIRELVLLEQAERESAAITESQRMAVRAYCDAGNRRQNVAQDLRGPTQIAVAIGLYRNACFLYAIAFLVSKDPNTDPASLTPDLAFDKATELARSQGAPIPPEVERVRPFLLVSDPLEIDQLSSDDADRAASELEIVARWLRGLFDPRSPREVRVARVLRVGGLIACAALLLVMLGIRIFAPTNWARGKPATASSYMFGTTAEGAVDGSKSGQYGYHSQQEESPWLAIDLGARFSITTAKVFGRGDAFHDQSIPLAFEVSDDGASYREVARRTEAFSADEPWIIKPTGLVTRFVRLKTMRQSYLVLGEVEVYGKKSP